MTLLEVVYASVTGQTFVSEISLQNPKPSDTFTWEARLTRVEPIASSSQSTGGVAYMAFSSEVFVQETAATAAGTLVAGLIGVEVLRRRGADVLCKVRPIVGLVDLLGLGWIVAMLYVAKWVDDRQQYASWEVVFVVLAAPFYGSVEPRLVRRWPRDGRPRRQGTHGRMAAVLVVHQAAAGPPVPMRATTRTPCTLNAQL